MEYIEEAIATSRTLQICVEPSTLNTKNKRIPKPGPIDLVACQAALVSVLTSWNIGQAEIAGIPRIQAFLLPSLPLIARQLHPLIRVQAILKIFVAFCGRYWPVGSSVTFAAGVRGSVPRRLNLVGARDATGFLAF